MWKEKIWKFVSPKKLFFPNSHIKDMTISKGTIKKYTEIIMIILFSINFYY